jgi:hypothetical protein
MGPSENNSNEDITLQLIYFLFHIALSLVRAGPEGSVEKPSELLHKDA